MIGRDHRKADEAFPLSKHLPHYGRDDKRQRQNIDRSRTKSDSRPVFTSNKLKVTSKAIQQRVNYHEIFQDQIEIYKRALQKDLSRKLDQSNDELNEKLNAVTEDFEKQCNVMESAIHPLQQNLRLERVAVGKGDEEKQFVILENQMAEFAKIKEEKYTILISLWKEYEIVQVQLIQCAIAILGEDEIKLTEQDMLGKGMSDEGDGPAAQHRQILQLDHAREQHTEFEQSYTSALACFDDIQVQLSSLTRSALKENKGLLQSFRTSREKQIDELKGFLEKMGML